MLRSLMLALAALLGIAHGISMARAEMPENLARLKQQAEARSVT